MARLRIFPLAPFGRSSVNRTIRGTLYADSRVPAHATTSSAVSVEPDRSTTTAAISS